MKALSIGYLSRVSVGNVNASHTEGNVMVTKKVTLPDGSTLPYISGQAVRRMLRDRLEDLGFTLSEPFSQVSGQEVNPPVRPWEFIDEDLFGYLDASGGRRRTSPVRTSAAVGLFPFQGDRDLGTRSFEKFGRSAHEGGNMFETEVYTNLFRGTLLIELDRIGRFVDRELFPSDAKKAKEITIPPTLAQEEVAFGSRTETHFILPAAERQKRLKKLINALELLWGGGRTARMLVDLAPRFVAFAPLTAKHPVFLEALQVDYANGGFHLRTLPLTATLDRFSAYLSPEQTLFGLDPGFFQNEPQIREQLTAYGQVLTVPEAFRKMKAQVDALWTS